MGKIDAYHVLVGKLEGKIKHGRPRHRWGDKENPGPSRKRMASWTALMWLRI
jgi:hypothetical protein